MCIDSARSCLPAHRFLIVVAACFLLCDSCAEVWLSDHEMTRDMLERYGYPLLFVIDIRTAMNIIVRVGLMYVGRFLRGTEIGDHRNIQHNYAFPYGCEWRNLITYKPQVPPAGRGRGRGRGGGRG